jgi:hypothetical protein
MVIVVHEAMGDPPPDSQTLRVMSWKVSYNDATMRL